MSRDFRNFTISNAADKDIERFKTFQSQVADHRAHTAFNHVLNLAEGKQGPPSELYDKYQDALAEIERLKAEKAGLSEAEANNSKALAGLQVENEALQVEIAELKTELEKARLSAAEAPVISGNAFIFEPSEIQYNQMRRTISYLIKQGKLNRTDKDLPQQLTSKAIQYLIKNEYDHILK